LKQGFDDDGTVKFYSPSLFPCKIATSKHNDVNITLTAIQWDFAQSDMKWNTRM